MRTVMKKVVIFDLQDVKKNKDLLKTVVKNHSDINISYGWYDATISRFTEKLETMGFYNIKINFSGFGSQGDGSSFTANIETEDVLKLLNIELLFNLDVLENHNYNLNIFNFEDFNIKDYFCKNVEFEIVRNASNYHHNETVTACSDVLLDNNEFLCYEFEKKAIEVEDKLEEFKNDFCINLYRYLNDDFDYLTSSDGILETLEVNGVEFLKDGSIYQ